MRQSMIYAFWIGLALLARLLPHPPNFTPFAALITLIGCQLRPRAAMVITLMSLLISDITLGWVFNLPVFGSWSLFTYSGFAMLAWASQCLYQRRTFLRIAGFSLSAVFLYWVWTNFGTWLLSGLYPHSGAGLTACFVAGLPFLQMSLLSAVIFEPLFYLLILFSEKALSPEGQSL